MFVKRLHPDHNRKSLPTRRRTRDHPIVRVSVRAQEHRELHLRCIPRMHRRLPFQDRHRKGARESEKHVQCAIHDLPKVEHSGASSSSIIRLHQLFEIFRLLPRRLLHRPGGMSAENEIERIHELADELNVEAEDVLEYQIIS
jgi:hypothetical protein